MCIDYGRAYRNREMVKYKRNIAGYVFIENVLRGWPIRIPLPSWIPQGELPVVGKEEALRYGMHEIDNYYGVNND